MTLGMPDADSTQTVNFFVTVPRLWARYRLKLETFLDESHDNLWKDDQGLETVHTQHRELVSVFGSDDTGPG